MPETTIFELDLFWKLLKIRRVVIVSKFKFSFSRSVGRNCQYEKHNGGCGNFAFLLCKIDFFSHVFGNDYDAFTNGLFGIDCSQDSKAVIVSYILVLYGFQSLFLFIVYFMLIIPSVTLIRFFFKYKGV